jgi:hypothetical protein
MNIDFLINESDRATTAELQSDDQLRGLTALIDDARGASPTITATDCSKLISAALLLNDRLKLNAGAALTNVKRARYALSADPGSAAQG